MTGGGGVFGASGDGVFSVQNYLRTQTDSAIANASLPPGPDTQGDLLDRINKLDRAHQNITFAQGVVEWVLRNVTQLQP